MKRKMKLTEYILFKLKKIKMKEKKSEEVN